MPRSPYSVEDSWHGLWVQCLGSIPSMGLHGECWKWIVVIKKYRNSLCTVRVARVRSSLLSQEYSPASSGPTWLRVNERSRPSARISRCSLDVSSCPFFSHMTSPLVLHSSHQNSTVSPSIAETSERPRTNFTGSSEESKE